MLIHFRSFLALFLALNGVTSVSQTTEKTPKIHKATLTPAKIDQIQKSNKGYKQCQQDVSAEVQNRKLSEGEIKAKFAVCEDSYPGASLYVSCKKQKLKELKDGGKKIDDPKMEIKECKQYLSAAMFDPTGSAPFLVHQGKVYFAGVGLNADVSRDKISIPNFDCKKVQNLKKAADGTFTLFGNKPSAFEGWASTNPFSAVKSENKKTTKSKKKPQEKAVESSSRVIEPFGQITGKGADQSLFFTLASCDFTGELGDRFSGLSIYYLINLSSKMATPYFGVAHFKPEQKALVARTLLQDGIFRLGSGYRSVAKKGGKAYFLAAQPLTAFDDENDPKDVCLKPRKHQFLGVIQTSKDQPTQPSYALIANIENLCRFGDQISKKK